MMMKQNITRSKLRDALDRADGVSDSAAEATIVELRKFLKRYVKAFKAAMLDFSSNEKALIDLAEQQQMIALAQDILEEAGYGDVVDRFREELGKVEKESIRYFKEFMDKTPTYSGVAREAIELMSDAFVENLDLTIDQRLVKPLENYVRQTTLALNDRKQAVQEIARYIDTSGIVRKDGEQFTAVNIETLVAETPRRFAEVIRATQATELGLQVFVYTGPLDKVTSEQCEFLLTEKPHGAAGMWYREEIKVGMHPELKENPLTARGHYGCRHQWGPVDEAGAKRIDPAFVPRSKEKSEQREAA